jgi:hypothetical protein
MPGSFSPHLGALAAPVFAIAIVLVSNRLGQCGKPGYQSRFEPMTGTLETFVTLAAIGSLSGGSPGRRLLSEAPTATNSRIILRPIGKGSASGIVGLVRVT